jgi:hypothetical protein
MSGGKMIKIVFQIALALGILAFQIQGPFANDTPPAHVTAGGIPLDDEWKVKLYEFCSKKRDSSLFDRVEGISRC